MTAIEKLVAALREANAPKVLITSALAGCYDDFASESATPIMDLVRDAEAAGLTDIVRRAKSGEFDS